MAATQESITPIRVRYAETDAMGIVHHGAPSARRRSLRAGAPRGARCDRGVVQVVEVRHA